MKDFSLIDGSSGSFPDVVAVDCSGPGEIDGFAIIADYLNDSGLGWIQALLNEIGETPNGSNEADGASQILDAIKLIGTLKMYHPCSWISAWDGSNPDWEYIISTNRLDSLVNYAGAVLPVFLPIGTLDTEFTIRVDPGAARSGTNRMAVQLYKQTRTGSLSTVGTIVYDNGTASEQDMIVTNNSLVVAADEMYLLRLTAGHDAATNQDDIRATTLDVSFS